MHSIPVSVATDFESSFARAGTKIEELSPEIRGKVQKMEEYLEGKSGVVGSVVVGEYSTLIDDRVNVIAKANLPNNVVETFKDGVYRTAQANENITVYRNFGGSAKLKGSYTTTTMTASRENLALVPDFNNTMRFRSEIEIPQGEVINIGKVGPWPPNNPLMQGGADQILLPQFYDESWIKNITDLETGQVYTLAEFKSTFPGQ